jgi:hypothetical protein
MDEHKIPHFWHLHFSFPNLQLRNYKLRVVGESMAGAIVALAEIVASTGIA